MSDDGKSDMDVAMERKAQPNHRDAETTAEEQASAKETRMTVPSASKRKSACQQIRDLFEKEYTAAKMAKEKSEFSKELLRRLGEVQRHPSSRYVLL